MVAELGPGQDFHELFEGTEAARERQECVGVRGHQCLALVHGLHDVEMREPAMRNLELDESLRDHPDDRPAVRQHRIREQPHQTTMSAAVDQPHTALGQRSPESASRIGKRRIGSHRRAAEHAKLGHA